MNRIAKIARKAGVAGAGGAGFPAYIKMDSSVKHLIANGAECEPLLHKDKELMLTKPDEIVRGLELAAEATGATRIYFAAKNKYPDSFNLMREKVTHHGFEMVPLGNFYPSGDEYELVWEATKQLIPPGGIPLQVDTVVNNVETLYNIAMADKGNPVTDTFITVNGSVKTPGTFWVPIGATLQDVIETAGGVTIDEPTALFNGAMMGSVVSDFSKILMTKTSTGVIVVSKDLRLVQRKSESTDQFKHVGKSTCDQCNLCTQMCPRYLLGYAIEPHAVMRSLGFKESHSPIWDRFGLLCCECNICSLYACPEELNPKQVCVEAKGVLIPAGQGRDFPESPEKLHEMKEYRRVPLTRLTQKLGLNRYSNPAPARDVEMSLWRVTIPLKQHVGETAKPIVDIGASVAKGDLIADLSESTLGLPVHASITGKVTDVAENHITIEQ